MMMDYQNVPTVVVFNKIDLVEDDTLEELSDIYEKCGCKVIFISTYDNKGITNFFRLDNDDLEIDTVIVKRRKSIQGKYTKDRKNIETNEKKSDDHLEGQMSIEDVLEESNEEIVTTNIDEKEFQEAEFENETVNKANVGVTSAFNNLLNRNKSNGGVY